MAAARLRQSRCADHKRESLDGSNDVWLLIMQAATCSASDLRKPIASRNSEIVISSSFSALIRTDALRLSAFWSPNMIALDPTRILTYIPERVKQLKNGAPEDATNAHMMALI